MMTGEEVRSAALSLAIQRLTGTTCGPSSVCSVAAKFASFIADGEIVPDKTMEEIMDTVRANSMRLVPPTAQEVQDWSIPTAGEAHG